MSDSKRQPNGRFAPGVSGNPTGGSKALHEVQELARKYTAENIEGLMEIARNPKLPAQARVAARVAVLDRGWGKPGQAVDLNLGTQDDLDGVLEALNGRTRGIPTRPIQ